MGIIFLFLTIPAGAATFNIANGDVTAFINAINTANNTVGDDTIKLVGDGCCGGSYTFLANTYFQCDSASLFDWGMTHVEASVPMSTNLHLCGLLEVDTSGLDHFGFGVKVSW